MKKLAPAQLRVLRICARAKANGYHWWHLVYRHDGLIFHKLIKKGYIVNGVEQAENGYWCWTFELTPLGKKAISFL